MIAGPPLMLPPKDEDAYTSWLSRKARILSRCRLDCGCPKEDRNVYIRGCCDMACCEAHRHGEHDHAEPRPETPKPAPRFSEQADSVHGGIITGLPTTPPQSDVMEDLRRGYEMLERAGGYRPADPEPSQQLVDALGERAIPKRRPRWLRWWTA